MEAQQRATTVNLKGYSAFMDTLSAAMSFLEKNPNVQDRIRGASEVLNRFKVNMNETERVMEFMKERKREMADVLENYGDIPHSVTKRFNELKKSSYDYAAQIKEYQELIDHPKKAEAKAFEILRKDDRFREFMQKTVSSHSSLNYLVARAIQKV